MRDIAERSGDDTDTSLPPNKTATPKKSASRSKRNTSVNTNQVTTSTDGNIDRKDTETKHKVKGSHKKKRHEKNHEDTSFSNDHRHPKVDRKAPKDNEDQSLKHKVSSTIGAVDIQTQNLSTSVSQLENDSFAEKSTENNPTESSEHSVHSDQVSEDSREEIETSKISRKKQKINRSVGEKVVENSQRISSKSNSNSVTEITPKKSHQLLNETSRESNQHNFCSSNASSSRITSRRSDQSIENQNESVGLHSTSSTASVTKISKSNKSYHLNKIMSKTPKTAQKSKQHSLSSPKKNYSKSHEESLELADSPSLPSYNKSVQRKRQSSLNPKSSRVSMIQEPGHKKDKQNIWKSTNKRKSSDRCVHRCALHFVLRM